MRSEQSDYILRIIEQLGAALQRVRELLGLGSAGAQEACAQLDAAEDELLGERAGMLREVDADTAAALIGDPRQLELWGQLIRARADAFRVLGRAAEADTLEKRADKLRRAALEF